MIQTLTYDGKSVRVEVRDPNDHIQKCWVAGEFYEKTALDWIYKNVPHMSVVVDVGACIGNHTLFLSCVMGCGVHVVEPCTDSMGHLSINMRLNDPFRWTAFNGAAGAQVGTCRIEPYIGPHGETNVGMVKTRKGSGVSVWPLDKMLAFTVPTFVKIDVEGDERNVLAGMTDTLKYGPILMIETKTPDWVDKYLKPFGYSRRAVKLGHTPTYIWMA